MDAENRTKDTVKKMHAEKFALPATVALHGPEPAACIKLLTTALICDQKDIIK